MKNIALYLMVFAASLMCACGEYVDGVIIAPGEVTLSVGESIVLTATVTPKNAREQTVYWFTSDPARVTVDENGRITCVTGWNSNNPGVDDVTITVVSKEYRDRQIRATCTVRFRSDP